MYCDLQKSYKSDKRSFSLDIKASFELQKINVLYGVSGAGKTSLLRLLSGLDTANQGIIKNKNNYWSNSSTNLFLPVAKRNIAYVFQDSSLFPNMTVLQNIQFAKKNISPSLLDEVLNTLEISTLLHQKPIALSGGQQQRVALARAILQEPSFLFLDEPFTAIDEVLRQKLQLYLVTLQKKLQFTVIMISHNLPEVLKIADVICEIKNGQVVQQGASSLLLAKNKDNTLKAVVLEIKNQETTLVIGTQKIIVKKENILQKTFSIGSEVDFNI